MRHRWALAALLALAGCSVIPTNTGPEYRYSWVMLHDHQAEGVQVGPKYDAAGAHWSVYWWVDCAPAYTPCVEQHYLLGEHLDPNVAHWYAIPECQPDVYCPMVDGKIVARVPLPYPPPLRDVGSEVTPQ